MRKSFKTTGEAKTSTPVSKSYDEIWVYGNRNIYDPIEQYDIPEKIQGRIHFTGYIPRKKLKKSSKSTVRKRYGITEEDDFILVTAGGGDRPLSGDVSTPPPRTP